MAKYFGTDGIRAVSGQFPLTEDFITKLGYVALKEISKTVTSASKDVLVAQDTRASGEDILKYLTRGIRAAGYNVLSLGISTTPSVSLLTQKFKNVCGIVISASHNPAEFNGIKFFSSEGTKLPESIEDIIETEIEKLKEVPQVLSSTNFKEVPELTEKYIEFLKSTFPKDLTLDGLKIVLDCANGAASKIAPRIFKCLGAEVVVINNTPNGLNINKNAGALHTDNLRKTVKECSANIGLSFDGDADRLIACDEKGEVFDGDNIISATSLYLKQKGALSGNKVVLTVMANLGLINYLKAQGIEPVLTKVGDKYVFEELLRHNLSIGGETSGHIIFRDIAPAGDGILTAIQLLAVLKTSGKKLSYFKKLWSKYPLKLVPVKVEEKIPLEDVDGFLPFIENLEKTMGGNGRILVRYSGTEPLLRVLVEGEDKNQVEQVAQETVNYYKSKVKTL